MMSRVLRVLATTMGLLISVAVAGQSVNYQKPPDPIEKLLDAPLTPTALLSPDRTTLLIAQPSAFPTIADLAQPRYRLAGLRFNPQSNGPSREVYSIRLALQPVSGGPERAIAGLPAKLKASGPMWSPDGKHV